MEYVDPDGVWVSRLGMGNMRLPKKLGGIAGNGSWSWRMHRMWRLRCPLP